MPDLASDTRLQRPKNGGEIQKPLTIALVNNMPDSALRTTERQFGELLAAASQERPVELKLFSLPEIPRSERARAHIAAHYEDAGALWSSSIDGLIVTGMEPRAPDMRDDPYWSALTRLVDWCEEEAISTVWSCLAAHAAVLYADGIRRQRVLQKLSGVFECVKTEEHRVLAGTPRRWRVPHSRYHGLPHKLLQSAGYRVLSKSPDFGADMFVRERRSLSVYLQGHPEYDAGALLREYRRDIDRFLAGERDDYPEMPSGYFDAATAQELTTFRERALRDRRSGLLVDFPMAMAEANLAHSWREHAVSIFANWLGHLAEQRERSDRTKLLQGSTL